VDTPVGVRVTNTLADEIRQKFSFHEILCLCSSTFGIFDEFCKQASLRIINQKRGGSFTEEDSARAFIGDPFVELDRVKSTFDFIAGDLPLGMSNSKWTDETQNKSISARRNWLILLKSLLLLKGEGLGLYLVEPAFWSKRWKNFQDILNGYGFFILAVFNPPEKLLFPHTSLQPNLILVSREKTDELFIAEIEDTESIGLQVDNLLRRRSTNNLNEGIFINTRDFRDFYNFKISKQIEKLKTQYKEYSRYKLSDVSSEISLGRTNQLFTSRENAVYIPRVGNSPVIANLENAMLKHQNYIQVVLDETIVNNKYLELFFSSELGQLVLQSLYSGSVIPHINKSDLTNVFIPLPPLGEQKLIVDTESELDRLTKTIDCFCQTKMNPLDNRK